MKTIEWVMVFDEAVNVYHTEQEIEKFKENMKVQKQNIHSTEASQKCGAF